MDFALVLVVLVSPRQGIKHVYNIQFTVCNMYNIQITILQYTIFNIQNTIYSIQYTTYNIQFTIYKSSPLELTHPATVGLDTEMPDQDNTPLQ